MARFTTRAAHIAIHVTLGLSGLAAATPAFADSALFGDPSAPVSAAPALLATTHALVPITITPFGVPAPGIVLPRPAAAVAANISGAPIAELADMPAALTVAMESELLDRVNADRAAHGLAPVAPDPELLAVARKRATAHVTALSLSHIDERDCWSSRACWPPPEPASIWRGRTSPG